MNGRKNAGLFVKQAKLQELPSRPPVLKHEVFVYIAAYYIIYLSIQ